MVKGLSKIKKQLPRGAQKTIGNKLGITKEAVGQILSGKYKGEHFDEVINHALEIIKAEKNRKKKRN